MSTAIQGVTQFEANAHVSAALLDLQKAIADVPYAATLVEAMGQRAFEILAEKYKAE